MSEEIVSKRTPELIGAEIRAITQSAKYMALLYGVEVGRRLVEAKEMLQHGQWLPWLEKETEFSPATASRFMKLFDEYSADQIGIFGAETNSSTLKNISISNALRLLTLPKEERETFAAEHDVEHMSTRELDSLLKEKEAAEKRAETAEKAAADLETKVNGWSDELARLRAENKELAARPIETVVEKDEDAIRTAVEEERKKVEAEWSNKLKAAEKENLERQAALKEAEERAEEAESRADDAEAANAAELQRARAEAEKAARELEAVKKQLHSQDADTAVFKIHFKNVQEDFTALLGILKKLSESNPAQAEKLKTALTAVLDNCRSQVL